MDKGQFLAEGTLAELITKYGEGDVIQFSLDQKLDTSEFSRLPGLKKMIWEVEGRKGKMVVLNIAETLPLFLPIVEKFNAKLTELECRKMTLDDLFISMTGRHLYE
jgi:ABC-2 type transport system ATP-binding protein